MPFKVIASIVIVALAAAVTVSYLVRLEARRAELPQVEVVKPTEEQAPSSEEAAAAAAEDLARLESAAKVFNDILDTRLDPTGVALGVAAVAAMLLAAVWLGLGLTTLAVLVLLGAVAIPLNLTGNKAAADTGKFIAAVGSLTMSFALLMEILRITLGGPWPVLAVARNVVNEAVRLKVSLVFIVLLIFGLALLPGLLDPGTPLRYRVQSFLSYGTGGTFWVIATLVLFLSVGTVAFEQRDRVIWQTMTKPVAPWQYLLGKWLGVCGVAAVLLAVSASGVFLFTEYLRVQTAKDEVAAYVPRDPSRPITEDRFILQSQVLTARRSISPTAPTLSQEELDTLLKRRVEQARATGLGFQDTMEYREQVRREILEEVKTKFLSVEPDQEATYTFEGLSEAKRAGRPLTLRYKINVGGNDPRTNYRLVFFIPNQPEPIGVAAPLNLPLTLTVPPSAIDGSGALRISVANAGDADPGAEASHALTFPPDGLEVFYQVGSYRLNFARVMIILWMKLAFLSMVAIAAATCLSFPVASMVAFGVFFIAETAGFLSESLNYYDAEIKGQIVIHRFIIRMIALPIAWVFKHYAELRPTENLVDGRLVPWRMVMVAGLLLGLVTAMLYAAGTAIFRRRELATYSGH
jgi:hypothetical protein